MFKLLMRNEVNKTSRYIKEEFSKLIDIVNEKQIEEGNAIFLNDMRMELGTAYTKGLVYTKELAVALTWFSKGSISPRHKHSNCVETIYIIQGECEAVYWPKHGKAYKECYTENDIITIEQDLPHQFTFTEETRILAKTVPADPSFPKPEQ